MTRLFDVFDKWRKRSKAPREACPTGIKILWDPDDPVVDIVFVHGLNGHRENTWRHENATKPWPEAFLPHAISNARIMTYGYDATVVDWDEFLGKVSENGIKQHAQNLLETLASRRSEDKSHKVATLVVDLGRRLMLAKRPIIFVCHSLGGIVCKDALVRSHEWATESHLLVLSNSTRGIVFLGTPHKGAELALWAKRLARVVGLLKQTHPAILNQLQKDSEELDRIQESFDILLRSRGVNKLPAIEVKCFFEEKPMNGIGQVVDYKSAILTGNVPIGINKNHREMTKFEKNDDHGYDLIVYTLRRWIEDLGRQVDSVSPRISPAPDIPYSRLNMTTSSDTMIPIFSPSSEGRSPPSNSSSRSSFVKIPPGGRFIVNEKLVKLPLKFIPSPFNGRESKYFQPREKELQEIRSTIIPFQGDSDDLNHRSFLITGLGGAGKTELAFRFVTQFIEHFDAIFFLVADSEGRLSEQYSTIAWDLGLIESSDKTNQELCSETFRSWLADPVKGAPETQEAKTLVNWLLVFDNAESSEQIKKFWPGGRHGNILLTTRNPLLASSELYITGKMQLSGFPTVDGANFLRLRAQDDKLNNLRTEADAKAIVEWVEGFPMAIDQLGRIMYSEHLSVSKFREIYPTKNDLYGRLYKGHRDDRNLVTVWALNILHERQRDSFALLSLIAMLDPESIEHRTLEPRPTSLNADGSPMTTSQYIAYRKHLADTSLIEVYRDIQEVRVHRVVQDVTKDMTVRHGFAASAFKDAINRVADQWPFLNRNYVTGSATNVDRWEACRRTYRHILRLMEVHAELTALSVSSLASLELAELLLEAVQYRVECGVGHEAIPLLDTVETIYKLGEPGSPVSDEENGKLYRGRIGLAVSSKNTDDLLHYSQLAWEVEKERHRKIGHATSILAVAYNDLAVAWACHGEWEKAIMLLNVSRSIREKLPGFTRDKLFSPLYHLGLIFQHQGNYDEAEEVLNEAIRDREEAFGLDDAVSLRSAALLYARGNVRLSRADNARRDIGKSLLDHKEAVSRARRSAGARNRTTLICQYQVARVSAELGKYETACYLLEEILSNSIDKPTYHRDIARTSYLYAKCLKFQGKNAESNQELLRSLEIHNRLHPRYQRTAETLSEKDIVKLIPYDYL